MKAFAIFMLGACALCHAAVPQMWIKDDQGRVPLRIDSVQTEIAISGELAETTLTLRFRNETDRMQEGEFVMPLPAGATVSSFALEVNGKLRDGVAVEKQQARHAYETIKRQMIDPGLVEREANNTYRTKVFPIPAQGTKQVRISYIERLQLHQKQLRYQLPVNYPGEIDHFSCTIRHAQNSPPAIQSEQLKFTPKRPGEHHAELKQQQLRGHITITSHQSPYHHLIAEPTTPRSSLRQDRFFHLSLVPPVEAIEKPRTPARHLNIIWDASNSGRNRNHQAELNLLELYFQQLPNDTPTRVSLQILRNRLVNAGEFEIRGQQWTPLRKTLENIFYDGSSGYHSIRDNQHRADLTLFFTDARSQQEAKRLHMHRDQCTVIFHHGDQRWFAPLTRPHFGASIHLAQSTPQQALRHLTHTRFRIDEISLQSASLLPCSGIINNRYSVVGSFQQSPKHPIVVTYRNANGENLQQRISTSRIQLTPTRKLIQRYWAQQKLLQLEQEGRPAQQIIRHCRSHGLVSDYTSLIVLERFQDYLTFDIPPPEPKLRQRWQKLKARQKNEKHSPDSYATRLSQAWAQRLAWYNRRFSWGSPELLRQITQTQIWLRALDKLFEPADLDPQSSGAIATWYQHSHTLLDKENTLTNSQLYRAWLDQQSSLTGQWKKFDQLKPTPRPELAVSIRGLVNQPDTYRVKPPLTLKQSIPLAGGPHLTGSLQHVSLYRNAHARTYNLLSKHYRDIQLLPGDMIVVEAPPFDDGWDCDPFGAAPTPVDPAEEPAISAQRPEVTSTRQLGTSAAGGDEDSRPIGDPLSSDSTPSDQQHHTSARIQPATTQTIQTIQTGEQKLLSKLQADLKAGKNALESYQKHKGSSLRSDAFHREAARTLNQYGHQALALQVLSNIMENQHYSAASRRAFAYWLGNIGCWQQALDVLNALSTEDPRDLHTQLDIARYLSKTSLQLDRAALYQSVLDRSKMTRQNVPWKLVNIALTERNAYLKPNPHPRPHQQNLRSDIRCVIYVSDPTARFSISMLEPGGNTTRRWQPSTQGGRIVSTPGVHEFMLKRAMPGKYTLLCQSKAPLTLQIAFYSHWGSPQQQCQWSTVPINNKPGKPQALGHYNFNFKD